MQARYSYDAWGSTSSSGTAAGLNRYRFSTKEQIGGLYAYGYRFYAPGLGRWINRDLIKEHGGLNLYGFVRNNPISFLDLFGLRPQPGDAEYDPTFDPYVGGPPPTSGAYDKGASYRDPDFVAISWGVGPAGTAGQFIMNCRNGNIYSAPFGVNRGSKGPGASITLGWIYPPPADDQEVDDFLGGPSVTVSGGYIIGGGTTVSQTPRGVANAIECGAFWPPSVGTSGVVDLGPIGRLK